MATLDNPRSIDDKSEKKAGNSTISNGRIHPDFDGFYRVCLQSRGA
jgi:hypothetical protein